MRIVKAKAIIAWDVYYGDTFLERFDRKYEANEYVKECMKCL